MKPSELFCFKETTFATLLFFLSDITRQFISVKYFELNSIAWPKITLKMVNLTVLLHKELETRSLLSIFFLYSLFYITSQKLIYSTLCYIASRFILPLNFHARVFCIIRGGVTRVNNSISRFRIWLALPVTDHAGKPTRIPPFSFREEQRPDTGEWQKSSLELN